jgi:hypothetical protein
MMSTIALHMSTLKQVKQVFILAVSLLVGASAYAQQHGWYVNLAESPIQTDDNGIPRVLFAEQIDNGFLVMREQVYRGFRRRRFFIEKLDLQLNTKAQKEITAEIDEQRFEIEDVLRVNDRVFVISSELRRNDKSLAYFVQEVDFTQVLLTERIKIFETQNETGPVRFDVQMSPNGQKVLFSFIPFKRSPIVGKQENDYRYVVLMQSDLLTTEFSERIDMRVDKIDFNVRHTLVDDMGNLFFLGQKIPDRKSEEPSFAILRFKDKKIHSGKFAFKEGQLQSARIEFNPEGNILLIGYYYELKRFNAGIGVVSTEFDRASLDHYNVRFDLIRNEVLMNGLSERQKRKAQREIEAGRDLKLNRDVLPIHFVRHPSGEISMIGEVQYQTFESSGITQAGAINRVIYNYEHVFVTRIAKDGRILWTAKIPKIYRGAIDPYVTFEVLVHDEELSIVFNDNTDNFEPNPKRGTRHLSPRASFSYLARVSVSAQGDLKTYRLIDYKEAPFNRMNMLSLFTDVAKTNKQQLIFSTSGRMGYYYILVGRND